MSEPNNTRQPLPDSFKCAFKGILHSFKEGRNFKIQLGFAIAAAVLGVAFSIDLMQWAVVAICIGVVLGGECVNTAVEAIVDLISPEYNELAGHAKDCAAGAVLLNAFVALIVAACVFLPKMLACIGITV